MALRVFHTARVWIVSLLILGTAICCIELKARSYIGERYRREDPFVFYYPQLAGLRRISYCADTLKIGIFGSSVTSGPIMKRALEERIQKQYAKPVRVFNISMISGILQDTYYIYKWAHERKFWGIVIVQGIGELRMNHQLESVEPDFANITWFRRRLDVDRYYNSVYRTPCALAYILTTQMEKRGLLYRDWLTSQAAYRPLDEHTPNVALEAFSQTYSRILDIAADRGEKVFLVSVFYDRQRYDPKARPYYERALAEYNDTIHALAQRKKNVWIDATALCDSTRLYDDFEHLNIDGREALCEIIAGPISRELHIPQ